jgi:hypothetical protein
MCSERSHEKLVLLIRRLAREVAWEVIDEHLNDYEHKEKPAELVEVELLKGEEKYG